MHFNYANGKPFILFIKYRKEAMQNLSVSSTPIDAPSSTVRTMAWLQSVLTGTSERTEPAWVTLALLGKPQMTILV